jgi:hypothetical protein
VLQAKVEAKVEAEVKAQLPTSSFYDGSDNLLE